MTFDLKDFRCDLTGVRGGNLVLQNFFPFAVSGALCARRPIAILKPRPVPEKRAAKTKVFTPNSPWSSPPPTHNERGD